VAKLMIKINIPTKYTRFKSIISGRINLQNHRKLLSLK